MQYELNITKDQVTFFNENGYLQIDDLITAEEVQRYSLIYDRFLDGTINTGKNRGDLGAGLGQPGISEAITQIMWPSDFMPELLEMVYHQKVAAISRALQGDDLEFDFDMLISKAPETNTPTPWHQDAAYWVHMPDKRAVSGWLALDFATKENGCMWYVPGSHLLPLRPHRFAAQEGGALTCDCSEDEGVALEIRPGSCVFHHGHVIHYSRGNSTKGNRRAFIVNFRPGPMIALEREMGHDHGRGNASDRKVRNDGTK